MNRGAFRFVCAALSVLGAGSVLAACVPVAGPPRYEPAEVADPQRPAAVSDAVAIELCLAETAEQPELAPGTTYSADAIETYALGARKDLVGTGFWNVEDSAGILTTYEGAWYCTVDAYGIVKNGYSFGLDRRVGPAQVAAVEEPARLSAQGCTIKGNISFNSREKIYHVPGQEYYDETVIDTSYGERWFCSEAEAQAAGWRKSYM